MVESGATSVRQREDQSREKSRTEMRADERREKRWDQSSAEREQNRGAKAQMCRGAKAQRRKPAESRAKEKENKRVGTRWEARSYIRGRMCSWRRLPRARSERRTSSASNAAYSSGSRTQLHKARMYTTPLTQQSANTRRMWERQVTKAPTPALLSEWTLY